MSDTYRGWTIHHNPPPVPVREFDWQAIGPNYDAWTENGQWCDNDEKVYSATREGLIAEIDAWFKERENP